jgi:branched-chain amino acid transport system permease protein
MAGFLLDGDAPHKGVQVDEKGHAATTAAGPGERNGETSMEILLQQIINGLVLGSMYALVALGYTMVYGIINLINFAHGEVLMVGALTSWAIITTRRRRCRHPGLAAAAGGADHLLRGAAALNFAIEKVAYRPLRNSPKLAPLITAIGMSILLQTLAMIIWKPNYKPYPDAAAAQADPVRRRGDHHHADHDPGRDGGHAGRADVPGELHPLGRAMRATAENPRVAALMGVKPDTVISATFIIGAVLATIAGVMYASNYGTVQHTMGFLPGLKAFTAAVFGGIGNLAGAVVGGMLLG